jgi:hypothetical protein
LQYAERRPLAGPTKNDGLGTDAVQAALHGLFSEMMGARYREVVGNRNEFFRSRKSLFCISMRRNCTRRRKKAAMKRQNSSDHAIHELSAALVEGISSELRTTIAAAAHFSRSRR